MARTLMAKEKSYGWAESGLWVAPDGSYGTGEVLFCDTSLWEKTDFDELDEAPDSDKQDVALQITKFRTKQYKRMVKQIIASKAIDIRIFHLDEDGVSEVDPDGNIKE